MFDLGCVFFTDKVLDGNFYRLGYDYLMADYIYGFSGSVMPDDDKYSRYETMARLFPLRGSCDVQFFDKGGKKTTWNFYCVLGPNVLSRYIFLLLWFWYVVLVILTIGTIWKDMLIMFNSGKLRATFLVRAVGSTKVIMRLIRLL